MPDGICPDAEGYEDARARHGDADGAVSANSGGRRRDCKGLSDGPPVPVSRVGPGGRQLLAQFRDAGMEDGGIEPVAMIGTNLDLSSGCSPCAEQWTEPSRAARSSPTRRGSGSMSQPASMPPAGSSVRSAASSSPGERRRGRLGAAAGSRSVVTTGGLAAGTPAASSWRQSVDKHPARVMLTMLVIYFGRCADMSDPIASGEVARAQLSAAAVRAGDAVTRAKELTKRMER